MKTSSLVILENAELPSAQAHAILKVMELELSSAHESLATREDFLMLQNEMKAGFQLLRAETRQSLAELRAEMKGLESRLVRWVFTCILAQTAVMAGFGYFALTHLRP